MESRLVYKIQQYKSAVLDFEKSLSIDINVLSELIADSVKSGRVQKFEFCIELMWKTLKVYLWEINGIDSKSPKLVIKDIYGLDMFSPEEYERVMEMLDDRNKLSHIYNKEQFEKIYQRIIKTLPLFVKIAGFIEP